jgi:rubrerythrin
MFMAKAFHDLSEQEILALAISQEEDDGRIYGEFAERLRASYPATAAALEKMQEEESAHRHRLIEAYRARFGEHIPLIRRADVKGFVSRKPVWLMRALTVAQVRREIEVMEFETRRFYETVAQRTNDAGIRQLLGDLAAAEREHSELAERLEKDQTSSGARAEEEATQRRIFVLQVVQPGLAGLMDGSVSTLAPVFAAAFATRSSHDAFLVGVAASVGAGISMGFAEALSDDGAISGRGHPWLRGGVCGMMTALGGIGHTLPYLIGDFRVATGVAVAVVTIELGVISWIRHHFMDTPFLNAAFQVILGGFLVFLVGIIIGSA